MVAFLTRLVGWLRTLLAGRRPAEKVKRGAGIAPALGRPIDDRLECEEEKLAQKTETSEGKSKTQGKQRPRVGKLPTEETRTERAGAKRDKAYGEPPSRVNNKKRNKGVDLGEQERKRSRRRAPRPSEPHKTTKEKRRPTRVQAPFVEMNLDEQEIFLVLPKQEIRPVDPEQDNGWQVEYTVWINGKREDVETHFSLSPGGLGKVDEARLPIPSRLEAFRVEFPRCLGSERYEYVHRDTSFYVFKAVGNNLGRLHYLYRKKDSGMNPVPRTEVWLLLQEGYEVEARVYITEEGFFWEDFQPVCVDATRTSKITLRNISSREETDLPCQRGFGLECANTATDDFVGQSPLFTGKSMKIVAPREVPSGWMVWVQNKEAGYRIVDKKWRGKDPLTLDCPDSLPCRSGEFQVDICEPGESSPVETLFFRYISGLQLDYPTELIFPSREQGHKAAVIDVGLGEGNSDWEIRCKEECMAVENGFRIEVGPHIDTVRLSLAEKGKPETQVRIRVTIPRLKWRVEDTTEWQATPIQIDRKQLLPGSSFRVFFRTNEREHSYKMAAFLRTQSQTLQEAPLERKANMYVLSLNNFYDTIAQHGEAMCIETSVYRANGDQLLGKVKVIDIPGTEQEVEKEAPKYFKLRTKTSVMACVLGGAGWREGKGFSRGEIARVGLHKSDVRKLDIRVDKRRKTVHDRNVEVLKDAEVKVKENADRSG